MKNYSDAYGMLEQGIFSALETYSNVHRGSGQKSLVTTALFEEARTIILNHFDGDKSKKQLLFLSPRRSVKLIKQLSTSSYKLLTSNSIGLALGVHALLVDRTELLAISDYDQGGGTARMVGKDWVVNASVPSRFEAGTPAIINVIAFARALQIKTILGPDCFKTKNTEVISFFDNMEKMTGKELFDYLHKSIIGRMQSSPSVKGETPFVNMDHSATTSALLPVWQVFKGSIKATIAEKDIEQTKQICCTFLNTTTQKYDVHFTMNTTESINLVSETFSKKMDDNSVIISSYLEHSSNDLPWRRNTAASIERIGFDADGFLDLTTLEELLIAYNHDHLHGKKRVSIVALSGASNVMGTCQDIQSIVTLAHKYGAEVLLDAAQLVAHRKIDLTKLGADYLAFSGHKIYAPFGAGVLMCRKGSISDSDETKAMELENGAGILALGKSLQLLLQVGMDLVRQEEQYLVQYAIHKLNKNKAIKLRGINNTEHPFIEHKLAVFPFDLGNKVPFVVAKQLAYRNAIGVRVGCHCAHMLVKSVVGVGPKLEKFQRFIQRFFQHTIFPGLVRVSLGLENSKSDIDGLADTLKAMSNAEDKTKVDVSKMKQIFKKYIEERKTLVFELE